MPVIISAVIDLEPERVERALLDAQPFIAASRAEPGCIAYDWAVDPATPGRIHVFEEWESEEALAGHFRDPSYAAMRDHVGASGLITARSQKYRCDAIEPVYDSGGVPQAHFGRVAQ
ncbi:putative quinol monooxygenase [Sphingomonas radiodurans]|uniref:putative quinol monooxygenase n=1 Tax=Sphingomonas radiodurans TaxID=2890321 RepID=UPI001E5386EA|nr:putative quinol monooxygenase [Sphingomonas radiodurans]WBH17759.1 putative quinol monooxygenase [Sphingomonas radiodurans]